jgi:hypothetical protein
MTDLNSRVAACVGRLQVRRGGKVVSNGSAFLICGDYALSAWHVLAGFNDDNSERLFYLGDESFDVTVEDFDAFLDVVLLRIQDGSRLTRPHLTLSRRRPAGLTQSTVTGVGWPQSRPFGSELDSVSGTLVAQQTIVESAPALKIFSHEASAGKVLNGFSGGPVLAARADSYLSLQDPEVVGIIRWNKPNLDNTAAGGVYYATPIEDVVAKWPQLAACARDVYPLPSEAAVRLFLKQHLGSGEYTLPFGGREEELRKLEEFATFRTAERGLLVTAPSGRGKSTLMARYWELCARNSTELGRDIVFVPISLRFGLSREHDVLRAIVSRLAYLHGHDPHAAAEGGNSQLRDRMGEYLALEAPQEGGLLLMIDGLDETQDWDILPIHFDLSRLGHKVRLILSARETEVRSGPGGWLQSLGWQNDQISTLRLEVLNENSTRNVLKSVVPPLSAKGLEAATHLLTYQAEGDPLVLGLYVRDLQESSDRDRWILEANQYPTPKGLDGYLQRWWHDQEVLWGGTLGSRGVHVRTVFNLLACATGPLSRSGLISLCKSLGIRDGDEVDAALEDLHRWIIAGESEKTFVLSHPRLAQVRRQRLIDDEDALKYEQAFIVWAKESIRRAEEQGSTVDPYIVRSLGTHLVRSQADIEDFLFLASKSWASVRVGVEGDLEGYQDDLTRLGDEIDRVNEAAHKENLLLTFVAERFLKQVVALEATSTTFRLPAGVVSQLLRYGEWHGRQSLDYAKALIPDQAGYQVLAEIGEYLDARYTEEIRSICDLSSSGEYATEKLLALTGLARHLATTRSVESAIEVIDSADLDPTERALLLLKVLPHPVRPSKLLARLLGQLLSFPLQPALSDLLTDFSQSVPISVVTQIARPASSSDFLATILAEVAEGKSGQSALIAQLALCQKILPWIIDEPRFRDQLLHLVSERITHINQVKDLERSWEQIANKMFEAIEQQDFERAAGLRDQGQKVIIELSRLEGSSNARSSSLGIDLDMLLRCAEGGAAYPSHSHPEAFVFLRPAERWDHLANLTKEGSFAKVHELLSLHDAGVVGDLKSGIASKMTPPLIRTALTGLQSVGDSWITDGPSAQLLTMLAQWGRSECREAAQLPATQTHFNLLAAYDLSSPSADEEETNVGPSNRQEAAVDILRRSTRGTAISGRTLAGWSRLFTDRWFGVEALLGALRYLSPEELQHPEEIIDQLLVVPGEHVGFDELLFRLLRKGQNKSQHRTCLYLKEAEGISADTRQALLMRLFPMENAIKLGLPLDHRWTSSEIAALLQKGAHGPQYHMAADLVTSGEIVFWPKTLSAVIRSFPISARSKIAEVLVPLGRETELFPESTTLGSSLYYSWRPWAKNMRNIIPCFDEHRIVTISKMALLAVKPTGRESGYDFDSLLAMCAIFLARYGNYKQAIRVLEKIRGRKVRASTLGFIVEFLPAIYLPRWWEVVYGTMNGPDEEVERALIWHRGIHRLHGIKRGTQYAIYKSWLQSVPPNSQSGLVIDLLAVAPVGSALSGVSVLERLHHLLAERDQPGSTWTR